MTLSLLQKIKGFTLIELAVTMLVAGLLLSGILVSYTRIAENTRIKAAESDIDTAMSALVGFALTNGFLPCPDINGDGMEDRTASNCDAPVGAQFNRLPFVDLGVQGTDPWNQPYRYNAHNEYTDSGTLFDLTTNNGLTVNTDTTSSPLVAVANNVVTIIFSTGSGADQEPSLDQDENTDDDQTYVSSPYVAFDPGADNDPDTSADNTGFDDIIKWLSPYVLKARMVEARRLP